jgi:hypothetical protein
VAGVDRDADRIAGAGKADPPGRKVQVPVAELERWVSERANQTLP